MKIQSVSAQRFRRFTELSISDLPPTAKLVCLVGPNGSGKTAIFDAINVWYRTNSRYGGVHDPKYFNRWFSKSLIERGEQSHHEPRVKLHGLSFLQGQPLPGSMVHVRTAYRHDADFELSGLNRIDSDAVYQRLNRMIDVDQSVQSNYQLLVSKSISGVFEGAQDAMSLGDFRQSLIGRVNESLQAVFPDLSLTSLGSPLENGTFYFTKGESKDFHYKNLSGGEKSVFDLLLDLYLRTQENPETIYLLDEPEIHTNAAVQGALLKELLSIVPEQGQLWIATHSIGMLNEARRLHQEAQDTVAFLSLFDQAEGDALSLSPIFPGRQFWQHVMKEALHDLSGLVAPRTIFVCEGRSILLDGDGEKSFDASCYNKIFEQDYPDVVFVSLGSKTEIDKAGRSVENLIVQLAKGTEIIRLSDKDDMTQDEVEEKRRQGQRVLGRREIENYLLDPEVLAEFCRSIGKEDSISEVLQLVDTKLKELRLRPGIAPDEVKNARGPILQGIKQITGNYALGSTAEVFMKDKLAPLLSRCPCVYEELKESIFGSA